MFSRPANIDWCEENFAVSEYIAEFYNTLTSFAFIGFAIYGCYQAVKHRHTNQRLFLAAHVALGVVGLGSALFHATLLYVLQLSDELPMIWGSLIFLYLVLADPKKSPRFTKALPALLIGYGLMVLFIVMSDTENPQLHQLAYAFEVLSIVGKSISIARSGTAEQATMVKRAMFFYGLGFALWLTERKFCRYVQVFQLHALWHLLTGLGTFLFIQFAMHHQLKLHGIKARVKNSLHDLQIA